MPVHCAMMMPANQIHAAPIKAIVNARQWRSMPASQPGFASLLARYSSRWSSVHSSVQAVRASLFATVIAYPLYSTGSIRSLTG